VISGRSIRHRWSGLDRDLHEGLRYVQRGIQIGRPWFYEAQSKYDPLTPIQRPQFSAPRVMPGSNRGCRAGEQHYGTNIRSKYHPSIGEASNGRRQLLCSSLPKPTRHRRQLHPAQRRHGRWLKLNAPMHNLESDTRNRVRRRHQAHAYRLPPRESILTPLPMAHSATTTKTPILLKDSSPYSLH
jgi:hypothetical protein